jgi:hypothetical protein
LFNNRWVNCGPNEAIGVEISRGQQHGGFVGRNRLLLGHRAGQIGTWLKNLAEGFSAGWVITIPSVGNAVKSDDAAVGEFARVARAAFALWSAQPAATAVGGGFGPRLERTVLDGIPLC